MEKVNKSLHLLESGVAVNKDEKEEFSRFTQPVPDTPSLRKREQISKSRLINKLNYLNFQDRTLLVLFKHAKYDQTLSIEAKPCPCQDDNLECRWVDTHELGPLLRSYLFQSLLVPDGPNLLQAKPKLLQVDEEKICFKLPEVCREISSRKVTRHACRDIHAHLIQNSTIFKGALLDFNAVSFRVRVNSTPPQSFQWLNPESSITAIFSDDRETFYTGECRIISQTCGQKTREYVLEPVKSEIQRFKHKEFRSTRQKVTPSPLIIFKHPFTRKLVSLKALDLSGSGFSVEEDINNAVLLPGMMIPEMELNFANSLRFKCKTQVVYRQCRKPGEGGSQVKCGLALLDMDIEKHVQLVALLQHAENENSYVCNKVDLDDLWDFFFETGFIYPDKYEYIRKNKKQIKETYETLYTRNPNIARHFIYQDRGHILAHMGMVRYYENTWLIHHHAARSSNDNRAGLIVLNQIGRFGNDSHRLYSIHMDFLMCYYRPDNKFPRRVFGGAVRNIKNVKGCSEDLFDYFHFLKKPYQPFNRYGAGQWELSAARDSDLYELEYFYEDVSGGLMLNALNLEPGNVDHGDLAGEYQKLGFKRERNLYSLKKNGDIKAVFIVDLSDIGLNLSDLTNSIKVVVVDPEDLSKDIVYNALSKLLEKVEQHETPVMIYPTGYAEKAEIPLEKQYNLWVINLQHTDDYFRYLNRLLRFMKQ